MNIVVILMVLCVRADAEVLDGSPQDAGHSEPDADVAMETDDIISSHLQVLGTTITMVTQDGSTIAVPAQQRHSGGQQVTMLTDGKELQPVGVIMGCVALCGRQSSDHSLNNSLCSSCRLP